MARPGYNHAPMSITVQYVIMSNSLRLSPGTDPIAFLHGRASDRWRICAVQRGIVVSAG